MAYSRLIQPSTLPEGEQLMEGLVGIGFGLAGKGAKNPNIEDALLGASVEGMERDNLRILALLTTWIDVHHPWVNADRLVRVVRSVDHARTRAYWAAVGSWLDADRRFTRLQDPNEGRRTDLLRTGTRFQVRRRGEDPRFEGTRLRVPAGVLRDRPSDILVPGELAKQHRLYRQRIRIGPTYRADMWGLLESDPRLTSAQLARRAYGSYATAWRVRRDFDILTASSVADPDSRSTG